MLGTILQQGIELSLFWGRVLLPEHILFIAGRFLWLLGRIQSWRGRAIAVWAASNPLLGRIYCRRTHSLGWGRIIGCLEAVFSARTEFFLLEQNCLRRGRSWCCIAAYSRGKRSISYWCLSPVTGQLFK